MADEPTSINKNKSAVDILIDNLKLDLKEVQKFDNIDAAYLGGKAGTLVPVPKKFTAEQTISFMRKFPSTYPLADENAYFGIASALTTESPELFDVASFNAYEEKFGMTMEMQEKGASASKNITTAKTLKAANVSDNDILKTLSAPDKLKVAKFVTLQKTLFPDGNIPAYAEIRKRIVDGTATVGDAFIAKMYNLGVPNNPLFEQLDETSEFAKKFHKAFGKKVVTKAMTMTGHSQQAVDLAREVDLSSNFLELQSDVLAGTSDLSPNKINKLISPLSSSFQNVKVNKLASASAGAGDRKLFKGAIPPEVLETVLKQVAIIREKEGAIAADAVLGSLLGMRGTDLTETRTTIDLATRTTPQRPVYDPETGTIVNPVEPGEAGKGLKGIGDDRPLGPLLSRVYLDRYNAAGPTGELFPDMDTKKINALINKYVTPALSDDVKAKAKKRNASGKFSLDYTDLRRITASSIANGLGNTEAADAILAHTGSEKELDAKILRTFYIDVEDVGKLEQRGLVFSMFEKMMADALGAESGGQLAASLGYDFVDFEADYSDLESKITMDAPTGTDSRPAAVAPTAEQAEVNAELSESRGKLTAAELDAQAAAKESEALDKRIATAERKAAAQEAGVLPGDKPAVKSEDVKPNAADDISDEVKGKMSGLGLDDFFGFTKKGLLPAILGGGAVYSFIEDAGAVVRDVAIEGAATAVKLGPKVGGALPMILSSSPAYAPQPKSEPMMAEDPYPGQAEYPAFRQMKEMATEPAIDESVNDMERMALEDSGGFITRNREPEVSPAPKEGFIR